MDQATTSISTLKLSIVMVTLCEINNETDL